MKSTWTAIPVSCLIAAVGALACGPAQGAQSGRQFLSNPTGMCQGALPAFETAIRKRPLAVQNEGAANAFVTCSFTSQGGWGSGVTNPTSVQVYFNATSGADVELSCTGVSGYQNDANQYIVKSVVLPASGGQRALTWTAADFEGAPGNFPSGLFSISCALAPGVGINDSRVVFSEEIGA